MSQTLNVLSILFVKELSLLLTYTMIQSSLSVYKKEGKDMINFELETAQNRRMEDHERKRSKNRKEVWHFR